MKKETIVYDEAGNFPEEEFNLSKRLMDDTIPLEDQVLSIEDVKEFVRKLIFDSTMLLGLFNTKKLTSIDLREHRQLIKDLAGEKLTSSSAPNKNQEEQDGSN